MKDVAELERSIEKASRPAASSTTGEEIDDSSESFSVLVEDLFCRWVQARQAAGCRPGPRLRRRPHFNYTAPANHLKL